MRADATTTCYRKNSDAGSGLQKSARISKKKAAQYRWRSGVSAHLRHGPRRHRRQAPGSSLPIRALPRLGQRQEPGRAGLDQGDRVVKQNKRSKQSRRRSSKSVLRIDRIRHLGTRLRDGRPRGETSSLTQRSQWSGSCTFATSDVSKRQHPDRNKQN
jgi:hypothetical protein